MNRFAAKVTMVRSETLALTAPTDSSSLDFIPLYYSWKLSVGSGLTRAQQVLNEASTFVSNAEFNGYSNDSYRMYRLRELGASVAKFRDEVACMVQSAEDRMFPVKNVENQ